MKTRDLIATAALSAAMVLGTLYATKVEAVDAQLPVGARLAASVPENICVYTGDFVDRENTKDYDYNDTRYLASSVLGKMIEFQDGKADASVSFGMRTPANWDGSSNFSCQITFYPVSGTVPSGDVDFRVAYGSVENGERWVDIDTVVTITETWGDSTVFGEQEQSDSAITLSAAGLTAGSYTHVTIGRPNTDTFASSIAITSFCCDYNL